MKLIFLIKISFLVLDKDGETPIINVHGEGYTPIPLHLVGRLFRIIVRLTMTGINYLDLQNDKEKDRSRQRKIEERLKKTENTEEGKKGQRQEKIKKKEKDKKTKVERRQKKIKEGIEERVYKD